VGKVGELEAVFNRIAETWGGLDIALHSIAFAPKRRFSQPPLIVS
jgi:enoyl-[acyl-carrier protein] reductase I